MYDRMFLNICVCVDFERFACICWLRFVSNERYFLVNFIWYKFLFYQGHCFCITLIYYHKVAK